MPCPWAATSPTAWFRLCGTAVPGGSARHSRVTRFDAEVVALETISALTAASAPWVLRWLLRRPRQHPTLVRRGRGGGGEGVAHRHELGRRLGHLGLGVRPGDDAAAGEQPDPRRVPRVDGAAPQRDAPLAVAGGVDPPDRPGVAPAVHVLELGDDLVGRRGRRAAHRSRRVQRRRQGQRRTRRRRARLPRRWPGASRWTGAARTVTRARSSTSSAAPGHRPPTARRTRAPRGPSTSARGRPRARGRARRRRCDGWCRPGPATSRAPSRGAPAARASPRPTRRRRTPTSCGYCSASRCSSHRTSSGAPVVTSRSRASTTLSSCPLVIRPTASATAPAHSAAERAPSAKATSTGPSGAGCRRSTASRARRPRPAPARRPRSSARPRRRARPTTTSGTTSVAPAADPAA